MGSLHAAFSTAGCVRALLSLSVLAVQNCANLTLSYVQAAVGQAREAVGKLHAASRTVEAVAGYLRALGDSTQDATAIDLDMGVSCSSATAISLLPQL